MSDLKIEKPELKAWAVSILDKTYLGFNEVLYNNHFLNAYLTDLTDKNG